MTGVPRIDIAALRDPSAGDAAVAAVAAEIDEACREVGFFAIVGHGVDPALRARLDRTARAFFALRDDEKAEIAMARGGRAWRGWFPVGDELTSGVPDQKEGLYAGSELGPDDPRVRAGLPLHGANLFPRRPAELGPTILRYLDELTIVGQAVLGAMAVGLGLDRSWFPEHLTADPVVLFRIFHYPPEAPDPSGSPVEGDGSGDRDPRRWGVAEHTDYGLLTLLGQDDRGGLEVRTGSGWVPVEPDPEAFVCNIGDMLERLTGGRYRSTPHRVRNASGRDRLSFPFFLDPSWDAVVDRLPIVERPTTDDAAARWDRSSVHEIEGTYGEYLLTKVGKVFPDLAAAVPARPASAD